VPLLILHGDVVVESRKERPLRAVLQYDEHPFFLVGVDCFFEIDYIGVFQSQKEIGLSIDHLNQLFLLDEILLPYFLEP
jgi:hypothetical protein